MCLCVNAYLSVSVHADVQTHFNFYFNSFDIAMLYPAVVPVLQYDYRQIFADYRIIKKFAANKPFGRRSHSLLAPLACWNPHVFGKALQFARGFPRKFPS